MTLLTWLSPVNCISVLAAVSPVLNSAQGPNLKGITLPAAAIGSNSEERGTPRFILQFAFSLLALKKKVLDHTIDPFNLPS